MTPKVKELQAAGGTNYLHAVILQIFYALFFNVIAVIIVVD